MKHIRGFYMALGMFSGIPLPFHIWDEKLTPIVVSSLPLVGLIIGALWWVAGSLLLALDIPLMLAAAVLAVTPFFIAGFIHLDGYMDTSDAILSRRPLEDKIRILKDPRVGAFAVVMLGILFLLQFAAMHTVADGGRFLPLLIAICVISRSCSAISIFTLRHLSISNYAALLKQDSGTANKVFIACTAVAAVFASFLYAGVYGLIVCAAVVLGFACAMRVVHREFKGISGDLLGYSLVISELSGLIALALLQGIQVSTWF